VNALWRRLMIQKVEKEEGVLGPNTLVPNS